MDGSEPAAELAPQPDGRRVLRDRGSCRGAGDAESEPVDQDRIEDHVDQVGDQRHQQRGPGVLQTAEGSVAGQ